MSIWIVWSEALQQSEQGQHVMEEPQHCHLRETIRTMARAEHD